MGYGSNVPNAGNHQPRALEGADGGFTSGARTLDQYVDLAQALVHASAGRLLGSSLGRKGRPLARALKPYRPGAGRRDHAAFGIGDADQGVVESGVNIDPPVRDRAPFPASCSWSWHLLLLPTSWPRYGGRGRLRCGEAPSGCERWCESAGRELVTPDGAAARGRNRSQSSGGCSG